MPTNPTCATCKYWEVDGVTGTGWCHRNPPAYVEKLLTVYTWAQPKTSDSDWCGSWRSTAEDVIGD